MAAKPSRSQFIEKLHAILEHPLDSESLRWVGEDAFEIISNDGLARHALSPSWDFRSLSSFIRQLSYYNFKRLSDRRRSSERRSTASGYIVFSHPSGLFIRGDSTRLGGIVRKTRNRPEKGEKGSRKASSKALPKTQEEADLQVQQQQLLEQHQAQIQQQMHQQQQQHQHQQHQLHQHQGSIPVPAWPLDSNRHMPNILNEYPDDRRLSQHFATPLTAPYQPNFPIPRPYQPNPDQTTSWRAYTPPWSDAGGRQPPPARRVSDFGLPINGNPGQPVSPRSKNLDPSLGGPLRKQLSIAVNGDDRYPSPYPTPTFPSYPTYMNGEGALDNPPPYQSYLPYPAPLHANGGGMSNGNGAGPSGGHSPDSYHSDPHSPADHSPPRQAPPQANLLHRGSLPTNVLLQHHHQQSQSSQIPYHLQHIPSTDSAQLPPFNPQQHQHPSYALVGESERHLMPSPVRSFSQPEIHLQQHPSVHPHYFNSSPANNGSTNVIANGALPSLANGNEGRGTSDGYDSFGADEGEQ